MQSVANKSIQVSGSDTLYTRSPYQFSFSPESENTTCFMRTISWPGCGASGAITTSRTATSIFIFFHAVCVCSNIDRKLRNFYELGSCEGSKCSFG